jgi:hypothetical protein
VADAEIARRLGISPNAVTGLVSAAKRRVTHDGDMDRSRPGDAIRPVNLPSDLVQSMRRHAARRDATVDNLIRQILSAVIHDDLVDAVLDDDCPRRRRT